jgi:hypothetical protein
MAQHSDIIARALARLLTPLVRLLLRYGVSCGAFTDLLRQVYVTVAERDFTVPGRKQTTSRIAVLTGLNRKEVARLRRLPDDTPDHLDERYNRAARVISGWLRDPDFHDANGNPADLQADAPDGFPGLVQRYSGDMTTRAIHDELTRVGAVIQTDDGRLHLARHGYIPARDATDKLRILGTDTRDLIETIEHNLENPPEQARFQRKVCYDNVPEEYAEAFRELAARRSQELLEELDRWLDQRDREGPSTAAGGGRVRLGLGIHQIEEWREPATGDDAREKTP